MSPRVFYGWWVTLAFAAMVFVSTGVRFTVGPFLKPMVTDLGLDRAAYSLVIAVGLLLYGAFIPVVGWLADRLGARPVTLIGTVVLALSAGATGAVTALWQLYLVWGVFMAFGLAATGHVVASAVVTRWFTRRRATALSVLGGASMAGMSLLVPVAMWLILTLGWRLTYLVIALALLALLLPLALWVIRESPEAMGLAPDGGPPAPSASGSGERTPVSTAVQTVPFWQLAGALSTCGFTMSLLSAHGVPMLTDHGYSPMLASWAMALLGGTSVGFALGLGALGDRLGCRPVLAWIYGGRALLLVGLFAVRDDPIALLVVAAAGGATMGGVFAMTSALTATIFGRYSVGSVFGTMFLAHQTGAAAGSWLGGYLFEVTGGYGAAFAVGSAILALAAVVSLTIDERVGRLRPAVAAE
ncbi:MAG TPA: MFS transporter [Candidatus Binatia bacterium]|nr:MFS transporter [Candidatus Binatia bacterium]